MVALPKETKLIRIHHLEPRVSVKYFMAITPTVQREIFESPSKRWTDWSILFKILPSPEPSPATVAKTNRPDQTTFCSFEVCINIPNLNCLVFTLTFLLDITEKKSISEVKTQIVLSVSQINLKCDAKSGTELRIYGTLTLFFSLSQKLSRTQLIISFFSSCGFSGALEPTPVTDLSPKTLSGEKCKDTGSC